MKKLVFISLRLQRKIGELELVGFTPYRELAKIVLKDFTFGNGRHRKIDVVVQLVLTMNLDVSIKPFYEPNLVSEYVKNVVQDINRKLSPQDFFQIEEELKGLMVEFKHRVYTISGLSPEPLTQLRHCF